MKRTAVLTTSALGAGLLLALAAPLSASAHVGVTATSTAAGSYSILTFGVGHGCDGSPTTSIAISIPEAITSVTPTVNPNWTISKVMETLDTPIAQEEGDPITERVAQVVYTANSPLAADQRDTFELSLPLVGYEGEVLEFPTLQTCEVGETNWTGDEVPAVTLTAAAAEGDEHAHGAAEATEGEHNEVAEAAPADDVLARILAIGGLVLGAVGLVLGITARRRSA